MAQKRATGSSVARKAAAEILDEEPIDDRDENQAGMVVFLTEGDAIVARITEQNRIGNRDVWLVYGVSTAVRPEEYEGLETDEDGNVTEVYNYARSRAIAAVLDGLDDLKSAYHSTLSARAAARNQRGEQ